MIKRLWKKWIVGYKNIFYDILHFPKNFYKFLKELHFFLKHGFLYEAMYNHCDWFAETEKKILERLLECHSGYPGVEGASTNEEWEDILKEMIDCLGVLCEEYVSFGDYEAYLKQTEAKDKAKERFFELFSKWYYRLWD